MSSTTWTSQHAESHKESGPGEDCPGPCLRITDKVPKITGKGGDTELLQQLSPWLPRDPVPLEPTWLSRACEIYEGARQSWQTGPSCRGDAGVSISGSHQPLPRKWPTDMARGTGWQWTPPRPVLKVLVSHHLGAFSPSSGIWREQGSLRGGKAGHPAGAAIKTSF